MLILGMVILGIVILGIGRPSQVVGKIPPEAGLVSKFPDACWSLPPVGEAEALKI